MMGKSDHCAKGSGRKSARVINDAHDSTNLGGGGGRD